MNLLQLRYHRFHVSYLLLWLSVGALIGLALGRESGVQAGAFYLAVIALFFGALRSKRWWALVVMCLAGGLLGYMRGSTYAQSLTEYDDYIGKTVQLKGRIMTDPQDTEKGTTRLVLGKISQDDHRLSGEMYVTTAGRAKVKRGDEVEVKALVREGFATYPATMTYARIVSVARPSDMVRDVRESFAATIRKLVLEPMASLGLGFVIGQRSTLPDTLDEQLKIVGLTHIVVASGYNLTILVRFVMRLLSKHSRYLTFVGSITLMLLFVSFSGFSPSMSRAVIVTTLALMAWYVGRRFHPVFLLLFVAAGTALYNPMYIWADLGWYLSFFAFAGVLVLAPLVATAVYKKRDPSSFELLVIETMSAELMALPLIALAFGTVPIFGLVANVLVAPLIPLAMILTAITGLAGMLATSLGAIVAVPMTIVIAYIVAIVEWLSSISWAQAQVDLPVAVVVMWYAIVIAFCAWVVRRTGYSFRKPRQDQVA